MSNGKSVKLFLVDGSPNGILTAEIINWTGQILSSPRSKLPELIQREECRRTGVYFLVSENDNPHFPEVYIGESDDVASRLKQHNKDETKDFWERVCLITSKDQNLTKTHIKYLESRLIAIAKANSQCHLKNGTVPTYQRLPESDIADMEFFLSQIQIVLPVLGYNFLKFSKRIHPTSLPNSVLSGTNTLPTQTDASPVFVLSSAKLGAEATAQEVDGEFMVFKDSQIRKDMSPVGHHYLTHLRPKLLEQGIIDSQSFQFTQDYAFNSPSAAATVILGRAANGRTEWKTEDKKMTYAQWQEQEIDQASGQLIETDMTLTQTV